MNERIKERREYFGLSQRELARRVGVGKTTITAALGRSLASLRRRYA